MSSKTLLQTPGPKIDREVEARNPNFWGLSQHPENSPSFKQGMFADREDFVKKNTLTWWDYLFAPFNNPDTNPGVLSTIHVGIMVFLGSLLNGWFGISPLYSATVAGTDQFIASVVCAILQGSLFFLASFWTYEAYLPTIIYPEIAMSKIVTGTLGLITALGYAAVIYGAHAAAGGILNVLNPLNVAGVIGNEFNLTNNATSNSTFGIYWFGVVVICFNWVYNTEFVMRAEKYNPFKTHKRAALCTAISIGVLVLAFWPLGLRVFSSGMYLTTYVFVGTDNFNRGIPLPTSTSINQGAFFTVGILFLAPICTSILYIVIGFFVSWRRKTDSNAGYVTLQDQVPMGGPVTNFPRSNSNVTHRDVGLKDKLWMSDE